MSTGPAPDPDNIVWQEPPAAKPRKPSMWVPIAEALKSNPGQWAKVVDNGTTGIGSQASNGDLVCFRPKGAFEHRTILRGGRFIGDVYLRYVGENREYAGDAE